MLREQENLENEEDIKDIVKFYESSRCSSVDVQEDFLRFFFESQVKCRCLNMDTIWTLHCLCV